MKRSLHILLYAALLGAICATLLTGASEVLGPYRRANEAAERQRNIVAVLGIEYDAKASREDLAKIYADNIRQATRGELTVYEYVSDGEVKAVAVPIAGPGMWGRIEGFLALDADLKTIRGISFYQQEETPGLGGEIAAACPHGDRPHADEDKCPARFRHQFAGKPVRLGDEIGIRVRPFGQASADNEVDAISGATTTCRKVEAMVNSVLTQLAEEASE